MGYFHRVRSITPHGRHSYIDKEPFFWIFFGTSSNRTLNKSVCGTQGAPWCWSKLGMCFCLLLHSRYNVLYYLCDCPRWNWLDNIGFGKQSSSCIAKRLAITLLIIALRDITFVISKKLSPSWRLSFRLVTNQLSLNTQSSNFFLLTTTIIAIEAKTDSRHRSL